MVNSPKGMAAVWNVMCEQPGVGVSIYDTFGFCHFMNTQSKQFCFGHPHTDPVGKNIAFAEGKELARERLDLIHQVLATGNPITLRQIREGRNTETSIWHIGNNDHATPLVVMITRRVSPSDIDVREPHRFVDSKFVDLGPLDCLTEKELCVLALIGNGLPLKNIASTLKTPIRTIENRRACISKKLKVVSLVDLGKIAHDAGLEQRHATLQRVSRSLAPTVPATAVYQNAGNMATTT